MDSISAAISTWIGKKLADRTLKALQQRTVRRGDAPEVLSALKAVVIDATSHAVEQFYVNDHQMRISTKAALFERDSAELPLVDGTALDDITNSVRIWVSEIESPIDTDGLPTEIINDHPLTAMICQTILERIQLEATRGARILQSLWMDFLINSLKVRVERSPSSLNQKIDSEFHKNEIGTFVQAAKVENLHIHSAHSTLAPKITNEYWDPERTTAGFIDRPEAMHKLEQTGNFPITVITGISGVGKTALCVAYGDRNVDKFQDGRIYFNFHSFHATKTPIDSMTALRSIIPVICESVSVDQVNKLDSISLSTLWRQLTTNQSLLLIWDNVSEISQIEPILITQPNCRTIITTRKPIEVASSATVKLDVMRSTESIEMFRSITGSSSYSEEDLEKLTSLDMHLPVLIDAHARQINSGKRSITELLEELSASTQSFQSETQRAQFERLDGSYRYLTEDQKFALRALGSHPGTSLTMETLSALIGCDLREAIKVVDELIDFGLVVRHHHEYSDTPELRSFRAHDAIRTYANFQAELEDEIRIFQRDLISHYRLKISSVNDLVEWIQVEGDSARDSALSSTRRPNAVFAAMLGVIFSSYGRWVDADLVLQHASDSFMRDGNIRDYARAQLELGRICAKRRDYPAAKERLNIARSAFERLDDRPNQARAIHSLGDIASKLGEHQASSDYFRQAADIFEEVGNAHDAAHALQGLGYAALEQGDTEQARSHLEHAAERNSAIGNITGYADALLRLGDFSLKRGDIEGAKAYYQEAELTVRDSEGAPTVHANTLYALGKLAARENDQSSAESYFRASSAEYRKGGSPGGTVNAIQMVARILADREEYSESIELLRSAIDLSSSMGDNHRCGETYNILGSIYSDQKLLHEAYESYYNAARQFASVHDAHCGGGALQDCSAIAITMKNYSEAEACLVEAKANFDSANDPYCAGHILCRLGYLLLRQARFDESRAKFHESLAYAPRARAFKTHSSALEGLGLLAFKQSDFTAARGFLQEALLIYRRTKSVKSASFVEAKLEQIDELLRE
ncbi:tetratricopeptide repeat protein [Glycomyces albidus]|uniref:Tetratricopeptide repeat protein n=1 Tax=Glycomyces albidus TaxID=2656774 RepID=A0A6L5GGL1_9ACTN|nr:tetratricopeptide repeat protein [Glycomyces albidus]MQM28859.1 tetratricopeptide repeat protein [Glycomyces albidus]